MLTSSACTFYGTPTPIYDITTNYVVGQPKRIAVGEAIMDVQRTTKPGVCYEVIKDYQAPNGDRDSNEYSFPILQKGMTFFAYDTLDDQTIKIGSIEYQRMTRFYYSDRGTHWSNEQLAPIPLIIFPSGELAALPDGVAAWGMNMLFQPVIRHYREELIYNGMTGNQINTSYNAYQDERTMPGKSRKLQFDSDEGETFMWREIKIQIISATQTHLEYRVVSEDNWKHWAEESNEWSK